MKKNKLTIEQLKYNYFIIPKNQQQQISGGLIDIPTPELVFDIDAPGQASNEFG